MLITSPALLNQCHSLFVVSPGRRMPPRWRSCRRLQLEELESRATPTVTVVPQQFATNQYTALTITQSQLLAGDTGSTNLQIINPTQPAHGTLANNNNGTFTFTPDPAFTGSTTFQYEVHASSLVPLFIPQSAGNNRISVAIGGDTALVGRLVFVRSGNAWIQQAQLEPPNGDTSGNFGLPVAISGDTAVVGGDVFVRSGTTWSLQTELNALNSNVGFFGQAVAISGQTILVAGGGTPDDVFV
jgi:hypothetical protein